jgi:hypothetical protein
MHTDQWVIDMRRKLHQCPEPGNSEVETTAIIEAELKASGIETHRLLETGIIGILKGEKPIGRTDDYSNDSVPRVIAFRADIDALEITESTKLPFETKGSCMLAAMMPTPRYFLLLLKSFQKINPPFRMWLNLFFNLLRKAPAGQKG